MPHWQQRPGKQDRQHFPASRVQSPKGCAALTQHYRITSFTVVAAWRHACRLLCLAHHHAAVGQQEKRHCLYPHCKRAEAAPAALLLWPGPHCRRPNASAATHSWSATGNVPEKHSQLRQPRVTATPWGRWDGGAWKATGSSGTPSPATAYLQQGLQPQAPPRLPAAWPARRVQPYTDEHKPFLLLTTSEESYSATANKWPLPSWQTEGKGDVSQWESR